MKLDGSIALFQYWNRLRAGRAAPKRTEIEPADIKTLLADTFILEKDARGEAVFRLAGTRLCASYGRELKGFAFASLWREKDQRMVARLSHSAFAMKSVVVIVVSTASAATTVPTSSSWCCCRSTAASRTRAASAPRRPANGRSGWAPIRSSRRRSNSVRVIDPDREPMFLKQPPGDRRAGAGSGAIGAGQRPAAAAGSAISWCSKAAARNKYYNQTKPAGLPLVNSFRRIFRTVFQQIREID